MQHRISWSRLDSVLLLAFLGALVYLGYRIEVGLVVAEPRNDKFFGADQGSPRAQKAGAILPSTDRKLTRPCCRPLESPWPGLMQVKHLRYLRNGDPRCADGRAKWR